MFTFSRTQKLFLVIRSFGISLASPASGHRLCHQKTQLSNVFWTVWKFLNGILELRQFLRSVLNGFPKKKTVNLQPPQSQPTNMQKTIVNERETRNECNKTYTYRLGDDVCLCYMCAWPVSAASRIADDSAQYNVMANGVSSRIQHKYRWW